MTYEAEGINLYELRTENGGDLPPFEAGSHIDLHLPNGLIRSYSIVNSQAEQSRYVIAVNKDSGGRGGSRFMHDTLRVCDTLMKARELPWQKTEAWFSVSALITITNLCISVSAKI